MSDGTPLGKLAGAAEKATDDFAEAVDNHSQAEAAYMRSYHIAFAQTDEKKSDTARRSEAEQAAWEDKIAMKVAEHRVTIAQAALRTRLAVLSAAQSHLRAIEKQT